MATVGYIGLGIMGKSIARNILKAGFPVVVHNRSREAVNELVSEGAKEAFSPSQVAAQADIIFTNLPDSPDVESVVLGQNGIIETAHAGQVYVDNSTIKPAAARSIAAGGRPMLTAPIFPLPKKGCRRSMLPSAAAISAPGMPPSPLWWGGLKKLWPG